MTNSSPGHVGSPPPRPIEWPVLLAITLPILTLCLSIAFLRLDQLERELQIAQQLDHGKQANLEGSSQSRSQSGQALDQRTERAKNSALHLQIARGARLALAPTPLSSIASTSLRHQGWQLIFWALIAAAGLSLMGYRIATRPWRRIGNWAKQLENGELTLSAPSASGLAGAIAASLEVIATRLRFSRDALQLSACGKQDFQGERLARLRLEFEHLEREHLQLQQQFARRSNSTSGMCHELRTPLTAILGFAGLLEKSGLPAEELNYAQTISKSAKSLIGMINDLLDMERIEANRLEIHEADFDPNFAVEDTLSLIAPLAYEKNLELLSIVDHDIPALLLGDAPRLQQILTNLLSNAIKFTHRGQVMLRVSHTANTEDRVWIRFEVEDTGVGISPEQQELLFTPFQRFESPLDRLEGGSGLGLSIVKQLCDLLQGRIEVYSRHAEGSRFAVTLPFVRPTIRGHTANWQALRGLRLWALESQDACWRPLQHRLDFWQVDYSRFRSAAELFRTLENIGVEKRPQLVLIGIRADEIKEVTLQQVLRWLKQADLPSLGLVNSADNRIHQHIKLAGATAAMPRCIERDRLYRTLSELSSQKGKAATRKSPLQDSHFLVAENNAASRHYLQALLQSLGGHVQLCENGRLALQAWTEKPARFVLLDMHMPELNGLELTRALRQQLQTKHTIIIGMSAYLSPAARQEWMRAGLDALLLKPFDETQLLHCLAPWLHEDAETTSTASGSLAEKLLDDPQLRQMILDELPRQLDDLDRGFMHGDLEKTRTATHQLHGTAAFFHLDPLSQRTGILEKRLQDIQDLEAQTWIRDDIASIRSAVAELLQILNVSNGSATLKAS